MHSNQTIIKKISVLFVACLAFTSFAKQAPESFQQCIACHGDKGQGNAQLSAPAIAGQLANYTERQLLNFANGKRGSQAKDALGMQMVAVATNLDAKKDIPLLAAYLASLPSPSAVDGEQGDLKNGSRYYQAKCGACHGGTAQGNNSFNAPKLSGQNIVYLKRQMQNYTHGIRGYHKEDKYGRQMAMMAKTTSGKELDDILFYIAQQGLTQTSAEHN